MEPEELVRRGLHDPGAADADDHLAMISYLLAAGVAPERLVGVRGGQALRDALGEHRLLGGGPQYSLREVAERLGVDVDTVAQASGSAGLPVPGPDVASLTSAETDVVAAFFTAAELFGEQALLRFTRVLASSVARVSEAAVSMFGVNVEDPLVFGGGSQLELIEAADEALIALGVVPGLFDALFRRHALEAIRRLGAAHGDLSGHDQVRVTVGFADLVGSTSWIQQQDPRQLATALGAFERLAHQSLRGETKLVKSLGDEVMFVAVNAADACRTALALIEAVGAGPDLPGLRAGIAAGLVAAHDGDYYGTEVNRAARLVHAGEPGQVLTSVEVAALAHTDDDLRFGSQGTRILAGFPEPVQTMTVSWAGDPATAAPRP